MKAFREITPLREEDVFVLLNSTNNGFDYPLHHHPEFELTFITGSSGTRIVGDSIEKYKNWDLVLVGPYLVHKWDGEDKQVDDPTVCRVLTLQFGMHEFDEGFFAKRSFSHIQQLLKIARQGIRFGESTRQRVAHILYQLPTLDPISAITSFVQILKILALASDQVCLVSEGFSPDVEISASLRLKVANEYILENFMRTNLRIEEVAKQINLSSSAFSHFFKKSTNRSFTEFLLDVRLGYASKLLINTDLLVGNLALEAGFNNLTNFNRAFKKHFKTTPIKFRRLYQAKQVFDASQQKTPGQFLDENAPTDQNAIEVVDGAQVWHF